MIDTLSEHDHQAFLVQRLGAMLGRYPELDLLYAVPNGERRSKWERGQKYAEGMREGVCDLVLPVARGGWHGLYCEMKKIGGARQKAQIGYQRRLRAQGYFVFEAQGHDAAYEVFAWYLALSETKVYNPGVYPPPFDLVTFPPDDATGADQPPDVHARARPTTRPRALSTPERSAARLAQMDDAQGRNRVLRVALRVPDHPAVEEAHPRRGPGRRGRAE